MCSVCWFADFYWQDLFVLLDLIGAPDPMFVNHFDNTVRWFDELVYAGKAPHPTSQHFYSTYSITKIACIAR